MQIKRQGCIIASMTEALSISVDIDSKENNRPFDVLETLCNPEFVQAWIDAEKHLNALSANKSERLDQHLDEYKLKLNQLLEADELIYHPAVATGAAYAIGKSGLDKFYLHDKTTLDNVALRYGGIDFAPIQNRNEI